MMKNMQRRLSKSPLYILFIGMYPVFALYYVNINEVLFLSTLRAIIFSLALVGFVYLVVFIFKRKSEKVPAIAAVFLIFFYLYGHIFNLIFDVSVDGFLIGRHRFFIPLWVSLLSVVCYALIRTKKIKTINYYLNLFSAILITITAVSIIAHAITSNRWKGPEVEQVQLQPNIAEVITPNVYYLIFDSYGREDVLRDEFNLDNHDFIMELEQMGFVIPPCTQSNYSNTVFSLTSSLNMKYLNDFDLSKNGEIRTAEFEPYIKHSAIRQIFEQVGYQTVTVKTVYPYLDITDATYYLDLDQGENKLGSIESLNFQNLFMMTTALGPAVEFFTDHSNLHIPSFIAKLAPTSNLLLDRNYRQYQQNLYLLDALETNIPSIPGNKFIYAHLFTTHQPFGFTPDGEFRWPVDESYDAYRDQIIYTNKRIIGMIKNILTIEQVPPIIILQGDHSYVHTNRRVQILNAYYLPGDGNKAIYLEITPVNTFRVVLNEYFNGNYEMLDDISYFSTEEEPYLFENAPGTCVNK